MTWRCRHREVRSEVAGWTALCWLAMAFLCGGCASRGNVELLEAQLRDQERQIQTYQSELSSTRGELARVQREVDILRADLAGAAGAAPPEELTRALASAKTLSIHPLLTGGQDRDGDGGDDVVHAVIYPVDEDGNQVKLAGELTVEAIELADETRRLARQTFTAGQARELWRSGFLGSGYLIDLPLEMFPMDADVLLRATLKTPDGRVLDTSRTLTLAMSDNPLGQRPVPPPDVLTPVKATPDPAPWPPAVPEITRATRRLGDASVSEDVAADSPAASGIQPAGLKTSDNWTDATIPWWR